jgi:hypothetical protein
MEYMAAKSATTLFYWLLLNKNIEFKLDLLVLSVGMQVRLVAAHKQQQVDSVQWEENGPEHRPHGLPNSTGSGADLEVEVRTYCTWPSDYSPIDTIWRPLSG